MCQVTEAMKIARLLTFSDYFMRIFSLGMITPETCIHTFTRNKRFDINLIKLIRDFYECPQKCPCRKTIVDIHKNLDGQKIIERNSYIRVPKKEILHDDFPHDFPEDAEIKEKFCHIKASCGLLFHFRIDSVDCKYEINIGDQKLYENDKDENDRELIDFFPATHLPYHDLGLKIFPRKLPYKFIVRYDKVYLNDKPAYNNFLYFNVDKNTYKISNAQYTKLTEKEIALRTQNSNKEKSSVITEKPFPNIVIPPEINNDIYYFVYHLWVKDRENY